MVGRAVVVRRWAEAPVVARLAEVAVSRWAAVAALSAEVLEAAAT